MSCRQVGTASFVGSANSRPAGVAFTVIGCTKMASGLSLKASVEYHWLVGAARLSRASVRKGARGSAGSPALGDRK